MIIELFYREQILGTSPKSITKLSLTVLANCRWYFNQEVQLITFNSTNTPGWWIAVTPKNSSSHTVAQSSHEKCLLLSHYSTHKTYGPALKEFEQKIWQNIGELYVGGAGEGCFLVNTAKIPPTPTGAVHAIAPPPMPAVTPRPETNEMETKMARVERRLDVLESAPKEATAVDQSMEPKFFTELKTILKKMDRTLEAIEGNTALRNDESGHTKPISHPNTRRSQPHTARRDPSPYALSISTDAASNLTRTTTTEQPDTNTVPKPSGYRPAEDEAVMTPSMSGSSTTVPASDDGAELNQGMVRAELNRALAAAMASMAEQLASGVYESGVGMGRARPF